MNDAAIEVVIAQRKITEVVHFTSNNGLVGSLELGALISRRQLPAEKHLAYVAAPTAATRAEASAVFNKEQDWLDYINLSVSEINSSYFRFATKWHLNSDRWWALLSFDPVILSHLGVFFATTNNIYSLVRRAPGVVGFDALFEDTIWRKPDWVAHRGVRASYLPTCEQAEVLYPTRLPLDFLRKIYVKDDERHDVVSGLLAYYGRPNVDVLIQPSKFSGVPN